MGNCSAMEEIQIMETTIEPVSNSCTGSMVVSII